MKIQTVEDRLLLGCIPESVIVTPDGIISWSEEEGLVFQDGAVITPELSVNPDILVLEL
jgi:hypothetical protein